MSRPDPGRPERASEGRVVSTGGDIMLVRVMFGALLLLLVIGALIGALERVAPDPSRRYSGMPRTVAVEAPDPEHPSPPCLTR